MNCRSIAAPAAHGSPDPYRRSYAREKKKCRQMTHLDLGCSHFRATVLNETTDVDAFDRLISRLIDGEGQKDRHLSSTADHGSIS